MKGWVVLFSLMTSLGLAQRVDEQVEQARRLEERGDGLGARVALRKAAEDNARSPEAWFALGEFLERHGEPDAIAAYEKALAASTATQQRGEIARRLTLLALVNGDHAAAKRYLETYRGAAGSTNWTLPDAPPTPPKGATVSIPGPLRSFARMAALSPDLAADDLLGALARNVVTNGYQASSSADALDQTEYLKLVVRYLSQARELEKLAGEAMAIKIDVCESTQTADLLRVLGYRMRGGCGSDVVLETVNATRAFLTIDSGFPLAELEQALRTNRPFHCDYRPTQVPMLYTPEYWTGASSEKKQGEFIDHFLADPSLCRLYLGLSKLDPDTAEELKKAMPVQRIKAFAHVLDFFGGMMQIRNGKVVVPGGARAEKGWAQLVGADPSQGAQFLEKLIARDDGWMASYFDALSRIQGPTLEYLTEPERLKRFYSAVRGRISSPGPARPVFRSNTDMMLLTTRLRMEGGKPHIPGGIDVWKNLFIKHPHGKYDGKLTKAASGWKDPDDVVEALFALCRKAVENEPLKIFMAMTDLNRLRQTPLQPATVDRLAREYRFYSAQYSIFAEAPSVSDKTILTFLDTAKALNNIGDQSQRGDAAGTMQSLVALWQIFVRQGSIPQAEADEHLAALITPFLKVKNSRDVFDAGRSGINTLLKATRSPADVSPQDRFIDLLAGSAHPADAEAHDQVVRDMIRIFEAQRLISLKTILDLEDHLQSLSRGEKLNTALVNRLAARIAEIQLPRASLSSTEKNSLAFGYWTERHIEAQRRLNLRQMVERAGNDPEKLKDLRGQLTPFLRDTLVGLVYVHHAPPGAQILITNPLFVRSHDFLGLQGSPQTWRQTEVFGSGWPSSAGGRLVGSLSGIGYALAEAEQNFLIPSREQALIWGDLVPQMILSSKIPRWWNVTPAQTHWVGLHMRHGEALLAEATLDAARREQLMAQLDRLASPARVRRVERLLAAGETRQALDSIMPAELFGLARLDLEARPDSPGAAAQEIRRAAAASPDTVNYAAISRAFGTPKPTLANSYRPELLNLRTFPTLMGYSSRIMAESWESNLLYYASLVDEVYLAPSQLNVLAPEWTQKTVERIFATHLEDWPALLKSLRGVGAEVRASTRKIQGTEQKAGLE